MREHRSGISLSRDWDFGRAVRALLDATMHLAGSRGGDALSRGALSRNLLAERAIHLVQPLHCAIQFLKFPSAQIVQILRALYSRILYIFFGRDVP